MIPGHSFNEAYHQIHIDESCNFSHAALFGRQGCLQRHDDILFALGASCPEFVPPESPSTIKNLGQMHFLASCSGHGG